MNTLAIIPTAIAVALQVQQFLKMGIQKSMYSHGNHVSRCKISTRLNLEPNLMGLLQSKHLCSAALEAERRLCERELMPPPRV